MGNRGIVVIVEVYEMSRVIRPCEKFNVKDLRVGDVIEYDNQRGFVDNVESDRVRIKWYNKFYEHYEHGLWMYHSSVIKNAELVGHVDLWNL